MRLEIEIIDEPLFLIEERTIQVDVPVVTVDHYGSCSVNYRPTGVRTEWYSTG